MIFTNRLSELTARETEVLELLAKGLKDVEISDQLFISLNTTKTHLRSAYKKLKVRNRTEATIEFNKLIIIQQSHKN